MTDHVIIELHKGKNAWLTAGAVAFVAVGGYLLTLDPAVIAQQRRFNNPTLMYSLAVLCMVFFTACGVIGIKKLLSKTPGLELTPEGLIDHSSGLAAGFISWQDIVGIREYQLQSQKFISIHVHDPLPYVERGNLLQRMANHANLKMCGTPINISANSLNISYATLLQLIVDYHQRYHQG